MKPADGFVFSCKKMDAFYKEQRDEVTRPASS